jgi:hypothetical protein
MAFFAPVAAFFTSLGTVGTLLSSALQLVALTVISYALAPKPQRPEAAVLDDLNFPTAEEGRALGVVFGRAWLQAPNVIWAGDFNAKPIKGPRRYGFFGPRSTIGYNYSLGLDMALSHGQLTDFHTIRYGSDSFPIQKGANSISLEDFSAELECFDGVANQTPSPYIQGVISPADWPLTWRARDSGLRGLSHIVMRAELGSSPFLRPVTVEVSRIPTQAQLDNVFAETSVVAADGEFVGMNPVAVLFEAIRNPVWGMGEPLTSIDTESFAEAHTALAQEGFGVNLVWGRDSSIESLMSLILDHIDGWLYVDRTTGKFKVRLSREDFVVAETPLFTEDDVISWGNLGLPSAEEAANTIIVTFRNRIDGQDSTITETNLAALQRQGRQTFETIPFGGVSTIGLARVVARRELRKRATPLLNGKIEVSFFDALHLQPGDPIRVSSTRRGLDEVLCRVQSLEFGGSDFSGKVGLQLVQDTTLLVSSDETPGLDTPLDPFGVEIVPVNNNEAIELPLSPALWAFPGGVTATEFDTSSTLVAGGALFTPFSGANAALSVYSKAEGGDLFEELSAGVRALTVGPVTASPEDTAFAVTGAVGQLSALVGQLCLLGDEWVLVNGVSGSNVTVRRGFLDSVPLAHAEGTRLSQVQAGEAAIFGPAPAQFRLLTEFRGRLLDEAEADLLSVPNTRRAARPYPVANLRVDGSRNPPPRTAEVTLSWVNRDRTEEVPGGLTGYTSTLSRTEPGVENTLRIYGAATQEGPFTTLLLEENLGGATSFTWEGDFTGWCKAEVEVTRLGLSNRHQFGIVWQQFGDPLIFIPQGSDSLTTSDNELFLVQAE